MAEERIGDINVTLGDNNTVGNIGHTIVAPIRAAFGDQAKGDILKQFSKDKLVQLTTVGGNADQQIGAEVEQYLRQHGYNVSRTTVGMLVPPPDHPFSATVNGGAIYFVVAPSAR